MFNINNNNNNKIDTKELYFELQDEIDRKNDLINSVEKQIKINVAIKEVNDELQEQINTLKKKMEEQQLEIVKYKETINTRIKQLNRELDESDHKCVLLKQQNEELKIKLKEMTELNLDTSMRNTMLNRRLEEKIIECRNEKIMKILLQNKYEIEEPNWNEMLSTTRQTDDSYWIYDKIRNQCIVVPLTYQIENGTNNPIEKLDIYGRETNGWK